MLKKLPTSLLNEILKFLNFNNLVKFGMSSKHFNKIIAQNYSLHLKEAIRLFFATDQSIFCDYFEFQELMQYINCRNQKIVDTFSDNVFHHKYKAGWLEDIKQLNQLHWEWLDFLQSLGIELDAASGFVTEMFSSLKEPPLPVLKLRRETVGVHAKSWFQNFLCDILYEGPQPFFYAVRENPLRSFVEQMDLPDEDGKLFEELRATLMECRWYQRFSKALDLSKGSTSADKQQEEHILMKKLSSYQEPLSSVGKEMMIEYDWNSQPEGTNIHTNNKTISFLVDISDLLYKTISFYCKKVFKFLLLLKTNPFDFLLDYSLKWSIFVSSISEFDFFFKNADELFNKTYDTQFQNYPSHPKFSSWRLMSKIWIREVYSPLRNELLDSFFAILAYAREKNIKLLMNENKLEFKDKTKASSMPKGFDKIPMNLYLNYINHLEIRDKKSEQRMFAKKHETPMNFSANDFSLESDTEINEYDIKENEFFSNNHSCLQNLLSNLAQSFLDISLNEINVHYLGHSEVDVEFPYLDLESRFIEDTKRHYIEQISLFRETPYYFEEFLTCDYNFVSQIINERSLIKLKKLQNETIRLFLGSWTLNTCSAVLEGKEGMPLLAREEIPKFKESEIALLLEEILSDIKARISRSEANTNQERTPVFFDFSKEQLSSLAENFGTYYSLLNSYQEKKKEWRILQEEKSAQDIELEEINNYRKLPQKLTEEEKKFFNLNYNLEVEEIDKIYQNFMSNMTTFSPEDSDDMRKLDNSNMNESLETYNEEEEEGLEKLSQVTEEINKKLKITRSSSSMSAKGKHVPQFEDNSQQLIEKDLMILKSINKKVEKETPDEENDLGFDLDEPFQPLFLKK